MKYTLEICANSIESALAAQKGGADRIELCDNMEEGGTTPSYGMIKTCKKHLTIPVFPIIRPRGGDFVYSDAEFEVMKADIEMAKSLNCEGVVLGVLHRDGTIDKSRCAELIALARPMQVTFHRAFDCCSDLFAALEDIIDLGCERVLTSGGQPTALEGAEVIAQLINKSRKRIRIMAGSGVTDLNLAPLAEKTGVAEVHSTAKVRLSADFVNNNSKVQTDIYQTSIEKVQLLVKILKGPAIE